MPHSSDSVLHYHLGVIRRRWPAGLVTAAVVIAILVPIALGLPSLYRSSASLMVDQAPDPLGSQSEAQMIELSGRLQQIRQEALSRQGVIALAEEFDLYKPERDAGAVDEVVSMMQRDVKVEPTSASRGDGRVTTISFRISYTSGDPQKAAAVANRLARFYVERNDAMLSRQATRAAESLKQELDALQKRLDAQERRVLQFTEQNAGTLPAQLASMTAKYNQLTQQHQANVAEITRRTELRESAQVQIANLANSTTAANSADPRIRLAAAEQELADLRMRYTEADYKVRAKRNEVEGLRKLVAERSGGDGDAPSGQNSLLATLQRQVDEWSVRISTLEKENAAIRKELGSYEAQMERAPVRNAQFEQISREASQTRQQYDALYLRYQNALVGERAQGRGTAEFQVLDPAVAPESPSAPDRNMLLALAALTALGLALGSMLLLDRLDSSFRSVDELRAFTHVPVLGTIPRIMSRGTKVRRAAAVALAGTAVSVGLWLVSMGVFGFAQQAEPLTRMLLR